jgi:hypothetical protein
MGVLRGAISILPAWFMYLTGRQQPGESVILFWVIPRDFPFCGIRRRRGWLRFAYGAPAPSKEGMTDLLFVGAMQVGLGFVYEESKGYHQHRPAVESTGSPDRATLPAPFYFRDPSNLAGCIAPTKNRSCFAVAHHVYVMSRIRHPELAKDLSWPYSSRNKA